MSAAFDDIPLPPEPDEDDPYDPEWFGTPEPTPVAVPDPTAAARRLELARAIHVRPARVGELVDHGGPHPRGLSVACPACRAIPGRQCEHPTRRVVGFVHPSRLDAEIERRRTPLA